MSLKTTNAKGSAKGECKLITNMHRDQYQSLAKRYGKAQGFVVKIPMSQKNLQNMEP